MTPSQTWCNSCQISMCLRIVPRKAVPDVILCSYYLRQNYLWAKNLVKQIKSGRKVFKLLKFVDEWKELIKQVKSMNYSQLFSAIQKFLRPSTYAGPKVNFKVVMANFLLTCTKVSSFLYYLIDNSLWLADVGMIGESVYNKRKWKFWKKVFNLVKNYTQAVRAYLMYRINLLKLAKIEKELDQFNDHLCGHQSYKATEVMRAFISQGITVKDQLFVMSRNLLRIILLNYKLKIVFWKDVVHPILATFLSIVQNIIAIFKIWLKKRSNQFNTKHIKVQDFIKQMERIDEFKKAGMSQSRSISDFSEVSAGSSERLGGQFRSGMLKPGGSMFAGKQ